MALMDDKIFLLPAYPTCDVCDPTGAGDSFAGAMMGYIASKGEVSYNLLKTAVAYGTVVGGFCVEDFSIKKLEELTPQKVAERLIKLKEMTAF